MAKTPATHSGHCQICDHVQKLPYGRLAKHGYTKRWGFFSGTCPGSMNLPFEQSMDMIPPRMKIAEQAAKDLKKAAKAKLAEKDFNVQHYVASYDVKMDSWAWANKYGRSTTRVPVTATLVGTDEPGYREGLINHKVVLEFKLNDKNHVTKLQNYDNETVEQIRNEYKRREADVMLSHAKENLMYIEWQTGRIKDWKVKPLIPVKD